MQAAAILLIAVSAGANPRDTPQAAEQTTSGQVRDDAPWDSGATLADHQYQLDLAARRKIGPVAPVPMNDLQHRNPHRGVQPATNGHADEANRNVRHAQHLEDAWPTAGAAAARGRNVAGGNPRALQLAIPNYPDTHPAAKQTDSYDSQQAESGFVLPLAENRGPAAINDLNRLDRSDETSRYPLSSQNTKPLPAGTAAGVPVTTNRPANANSDEVVDTRAGGYRQSTHDHLPISTVPDPMQDLYKPFRSENANAQQPTSRLKTAFAQPPVLAETPNAASSATVPPDLITANINTPAATAPATSNSSDVTAEPGDINKVAPTIPAATDPNTYTRGGGTLLLLAFFASVGLNFYLGWITWDTYNRYQDMVSDIRNSNTSARRERVERERVDRRTEDDRHLVDSAAY